MMSEKRKSINSINSINSWKCLDLSNSGIEGSKKNDSCVVIDLTLNSPDISDSGIESSKENDSYVRK